MAVPTYFLGADRVRCMLCSNAGTITLTSGATVFQIAESGHDLFLDTANALAHEKWLVEMKQRFLTDRKALKKITQAYRRDGTWLKPGSGNRLA